MRFFKPLKGCRIYTSDKHMTKPAGEFIGWCDKVDGGICIYHLGADVDRFIWRFGNGEVNEWFTFSA
jgi:hypothetical protein